MTSLFGPRRGRRVLICTRGQCADPEKSRKIEALLQRLILEHGLDDADHPQHTTCTITNCLAVCEKGPIMIVHPEGIKYHRVDEAALRRIFEEHLLGGQPVEALRAPGTFTRSLFL